MERRNFNFSFDFLSYTRIGETKIKITIILFCAIIFASGNAGAQSPSFRWARNMSGTGYNSGKSIAIDASGNVYTAGLFYGTTDFDPGAAVYNLTSNGVSDIFISKFDSLGNFLWAKSVGGNSSDLLTSMKLDVAGNLYATGKYNQTVDFDPGTAVFNLSAVDSCDVFVLKLDQSGNFAWAKSIGGLGYDSGNDIAVDPSGYVYTVGDFNSTVDFDPGSPVFNMTPIAYQDIFISKLDPAGNFIWAKSIGGTWYDYAASITLDASGNIYTGGTYYGTCDMDPGPGTFNLPATTYELFLSKLDSLGNFILAKHIGGSPNKISTVVDAAGNVYTMGGLYGTSDFDPGTGVYSLSSGPTFSDIFLSKLDSQGNFVWAKIITGTSDKQVNGIALDASANIYLTGYYWGTIDMDPDTGTYNLTMPLGSSNIFISKYNTAGSLLWAYSLGALSSESGEGISTDLSGNVYVTGYFRNTVDFDPGAGISNLNGGSNYSTFVLKLGDCTPPADPLDLTPTGNKLICENGSAILSTMGSGTISWYSAAASMSVLSTGNTFTTTQLAVGFYTYYQEAYTCTKSQTRSAITVTVVNCTGLQETSEGLMLMHSVYPNPFNNSATLQFNKEILNGEISIYDVAGKKVKTLAPVSGNNILLERGDLYPGVYYFEVKCQLRNLATGKFMISD